MRRLGAVLAGGRSSRFGADKAEARLDGRRLIEHAAAVLRPHVDAVVIVGGRDGLPDLPEPGLGPLGGIAAALDHATHNGFAAVLTIACDMVRVPDSVIEALLRRAPSYCVAAPVLGYWPAAFGAHALAHIEGAPDRSVVRWARAIGALPIETPEPLANINTRDDLEALSRGDLMAL